MGESEKYHKAFGNTNNGQNEARRGRVRHIMVAKYALMLSALGRKTRIRQESWIENLTNSGGAVVLYLTADESCAKTMGSQNETNNLT